MDPSTQEKPTNKRLVLTSVNQVITLVKQAPVLTAMIPKLNNISPLPMSTAPKKSCNCGGKQNFTTPDVGKQTTESILNSLSDEDFIKIKNVLNYNELCYYIRQNGELTLKCL